MAPGTTFRDPLTLGLRLVMILPLIPTCVMVIVIMALEGESGPLQYAILAALFGITIAGALWMHAFLTFRTDAVRIGFMPIFWRTIPYREIAAVDAVEVDPMRDYSGWGVKGRGAQPKGMLFSGGSHNAVRITLHDDRRYLVTLPDPVDDIVAALRARTGE